MLLAAEIVVGLLAAGALGEGLAVTFDGQPNSVMTFVALYGGFAVLTMLFVYLVARGRVDSGKGGQVAEAGHDAQASGRDSLHAGRDIHYHQGGEQEPKRAECLRAVRDEVAQIQRRIGQLEKNRKEWNSVRPPKGTPYRHLPAEKWNAYGAALGLSQVDHDTVQAAYELANDFNHEMENWPDTFGNHPDPDLDGLRVAFEKAEAVLAQPQGESESGNVYVTSHGQRGGVTAANVTIAAPQPELSATVRSENQKTKDGYETTADIHLNAAYAAQRLSVAVAGESIKEFTVLTTGVVNVTPAYETATGVQTDIHAPLAHHYVARVVTDRPEPLRMEAELYAP